MTVESRKTGEYPIVAPPGALDHHGGGPWVALRFALVAIACAGLLLPISIAFVGQLLFPFQARGSLIERDGVVVGSALVAQPFVADNYFRSRPSAANYDPKLVAGSNWAPSNPALRERIAATSAVIAAREQVAADRIPSDLVTASGSGIDPHISTAAAKLQVARIAEARGLDPARLNALLASHTQAPTWGILGQERVNVLQLNLAMDALTP